MKILSATYEGLEEGLWSKVKVKLEYDGQTHSGFFFLENDGNELEFEGFPKDFYAVWGTDSDDACWKALEGPCQEGMKEYGNL